MSDDATPLPIAITSEPGFAAELASLQESLKTLPDEIANLNAGIDYDALAAQLEELIPEAYRASLPTGGSRLDRIFHRVTAALTAAKRPQVPETDTTRPRLTPAPADFSSLPVHARIAAGYGTV